MLLNLVKKDFLLIKKNVFIMMFAVIAIVLFFLWQAPALAGFPSFLLMVLYAEIILCQSVSMMEAKYPKASALVCAAPYSRSTFVAAKYVFALFIFAFCYIVYSLMALFVPKAGSLDLFTALAALLVIILLYGIYMPLEFKFGFEKTKFAFTITLFAATFGVSMLYGTHIKIDLSWLSAIPAVVQLLALVLINIAILAISMKASIRIYARKEL
jgi:ABC-2 type transport system permease protein